MSATQCAAYFLTGATASGKSAVAQWVAEQRGWPILSADSMLVYQGMDVGTAKPDAAARASVAYHGLDMVTPDQPFSVGAYLRHVRALLPDIRRPFIVVGGTGLYLKALLQGLDEQLPSDPAVRAHWTGVFEKGGVAVLAAALQARAPALYTGLKDPQNARRLIRALELADAGITSPPQSWRQEPLSAVPLAGVRWNTEALHSRIEMRVRQMYDAGIRAEVRQLRRQYPVWSGTARQAIGYAEAWECEEGRCSEADAVMRTIQRTRQLAKRQRTWFAHQVDVCWLDVDAQWTVAQTAQEILKIWEKYGPVEICS